MLYSWVTGKRRRYGSRMMLVPNFSACRPTARSVYLIRFDLGLIILTILGKEYYDSPQHSFHFL